MIYVSGSIARDQIMDFPGKFADHIDPKKIHVLSVSFAVEKLRENIGGTATNICYNLRLLEEQVNILGAVNKNDQKFLSYLRDQKISTGNLTLTKKLTARAYIITDQADNQITGFYAGAMNAIGKLPRDIKKSDWAIIAPEDPKNMIRFARFYGNRRVKYIFDPGQQVTAFTNAELGAGIKNARILVGNDYEIALIKKRARFLAPITITTFADKGSKVEIGSKTLNIGIAKPTKTLDPTGAGDGYRAGFLKGLLSGYDLGTSAQIGATVASFVVEKYGTENHKFTVPQLQRRYSLNFQPSLNFNSIRKS